MAKVAAVAGSLGVEHSLSCDVTGVGNMMVMRGSRPGGVSFIPERQRDRAAVTIDPISTTAPFVTQVLLRMSLLMSPMMMW
jgi:hypothetical protein